MSFTPPLDQEDFNRTYYLGQTVNVAWNISLGFWPTVNLRISPFEWSITYAVLLSSHRLLAYSYHNPFIRLTSKLDNAPNQGGFSWTVGHDDGINASLLAINPKMMFQLNDANGADADTLDSRGFWCLR
jgi:hypothetical protein